MNTARVLSITKNEKGDIYAMAKQRQLYVKYLQEHKQSLNMTQDEQMHLIQWYNNKVALLD